LWHPLDPGYRRGQGPDSGQGELTDDQIREVYFLYEVLWPLETDLLSLLPKPDGRPRAVYTGRLHTNSAIADDLHVSHRLVELRRATVLNKLNAPSVSEIVRISFVARGDSEHRLR